MKALALIALTLTVFFAVSYPANASIQSGLIINEVMPNPIGADSDYEWIELKNLSESEISTALWKINGKELPEFTINPGSLALLVRNKTAFDSQYPLLSSITYQAEFSLPNSTATVELASNTISNSFSYPQTDEGISFEVLSGSCNIILKHKSASTPGQQNTDCEAQTTETFSKEIYIKSLYPAPLSGENEWVELFNYGASDTPLSGYKLIDKTGGVFIVEEATIKTNASLIIEPSSISLNNQNEIIKLLAPDGEIIDTFAYANSSAGEKVITDTEQLVITTVPEITQSPAPIKQVAEQSETLTKSYKLPAPKIYRLEKRS